MTRRLTGNRKATLHWFYSRNIGLVLQPFQQYFGENFALLMGWCWWWRGNGLDCFKLRNIALVGRWWQRRRATKIKIQTQLGRLIIWWGLIHIWKGHSLNRKLTWILKRKKNEICAKDVIKKTTHLQVYDPRIRPAGQNSTGGVFYHFSIFSLFVSFSFFSATIQF